MPHIPTLAISLSLLLLIGLLFQPSRGVLYLLVVILMAIVVEVTYRRLDDVDRRRK